MTAVVSELIRGVRNQLTPSEQLVIAVLLADYPVPGLGSAASLAQQAKVSVPTVVRLVAKLGFDSYSDFREQLKTELAQRLYVPTDRYPDDSHRPATTFLEIAEQTVAESVRRTFSDIRPDDFERLTDLLADTNRPVYITGGWSSVVLGQHLASYLSLLRPGVGLVPADSGSRTRALLSIDEQAIIVAFDYRAYQTDTVTFGRQAKRLGGTLTLFTDPILSPLAPDADVVVTSSVTGPPPFDGLSCGFMLVETLLSVLAERLGESAHHRLAGFEQLLADPNGAQWPGMKP
jgi:DNA-binding MurR/RpiR family transcriptional regulator